MLPIVNEFTAIQIAHICNKQTSVTNNIIKKYIHIIYIGKAGCKGFAGIALSPSPVNIWRELSKLPIFKVKPK